MQRTLFFDRLFPTRSTASIHGHVDRLFLMRVISRMHAVVILVSAIGLVVGSAAFATSWETSTMRAPGGGLVRIGMTRHEVLKELGQPLRTRAAARSTAGDGKSAKKSSAWTYRGTDGLYAITFSGERVVRIEVTPDRD